MMDLLSRGRKVETNVKNRGDPLSGEKERVNSFLKNV